MRYIVLVVAIALMALMAAVGLSRATEYGGPSISVWFSSLRMPDMPKTPCCGQADGYWADKVDKCRPDEHPEEKYGCQLVAIITDTRRNDLPIFDSGGGRVPIPIGTRISIPPEKVRKKGSFNPTGHNIVFVGVDADQGFIVYCWETLPMG